MGGTGTSPGCGDSEISRWRTAFEGNIGEGGQLLNISWKTLVSLCSKEGLTLAFAESCTGGFISSTVTDVSGASNCFLGSVTAYSNDVKMNVLDVKRRTIEEHGAVSMECAREMAEGVRHLFGSDISLSVTGVAGPRGGSDEKPVGTVFIGVKERNSAPHVEGFLLEGLTRKAFKREVSRRALGMLMGHALSLSRER